MFLGLGAALLFGPIVAWNLVSGAVTGVGWIADHPKRRRARMEAELDRKQAEMRSVVLELAEQLATDREHARKELIRQAYLAGGRPPQQY